MRILIAILFLFWFNNHSSNLYAQKNTTVEKHEQCATMQRLALLLERDATLKARFNRQQETFNRAMLPKAARPQTAYGITDAEDNVVYTIPVVFHIVLQDPSVVTDTQIMSQLDVLNQNFSGSGADTASLPDYFKPIFGRSQIRFCLAQRTPAGEIATGIVRVTSTKNSFSSLDDAVKHTSMGGDDIWNGNDYLNIWVCALADNLLGYGTFPNDGAPAEQGVVVEYRSLPGGSYSNYNGGKTLTHEIGHYFNLYHTWGDDNGLCSGTDYVDDTPNQANATSGCSSGKKNDNCTTGGNGILYQDYMDYSYDQCMLLFTGMQAERMEAALLTYRASLTISHGCSPVMPKTLDARIVSIESPGKRICTSSFTPMVTIGNRGSKKLTTLVISTVVDSGVVTSFSWTGNLNYLANTPVTLNPVTITPGYHVVKIFVSSPDSGVDENNLNDTLSTGVQYFDALLTVNEGFEGNSFPPKGWDIVNPDQALTWKKVIGIARTGNASVMIDNFNYSATGQKDYLRLPTLNLANIDSAYLYFQVAAATYRATSGVGDNWDTLQVLVSKDCGATYSSLYQKWGSQLVTSTSASTRAFEPASTEWRRDSVNLTSYINGGQVLLAFRNTTEYGNNIYLDDINIKTQIINPHLKATGFLVTPNPASNIITVQFYPNPAKLQAVELYNMPGQKVAQVIVLPGQGSTAYNFDMSRYPAGTYIVRALFTDKVLTKKIVKN